MMSQTCLMPPTGVPVEAITHTGLEEWVVGTSNVLPDGQLEGAGSGSCHGVSETPGIEIDAPDADKPANDAIRRPNVTSEACAEYR